MKTTILLIVIVMLGFYSYQNITKGSTKEVEQIWYLPYESLNPNDSLRFELSSSYLEGSGVRFTFQNNGEVEIAAVGTSLSDEGECYASYILDKDKLKIISDLGDWSSFVGEYSIIEKTSTKFIFLKISD